MYNRREFLKGLSGAAAGIVFTSCGLVDSALGSLQAGSTGQAGGGSIYNRVNNHEGKGLVPVDIKTVMNLFEYWRLR
jgi:hypothetical protein